MVPELRPGSLWACRKFSRHFPALATYPRPQGPLGPTNSKASVQIATIATIEEAFSWAQPAAISSGSPLLPSLKGGLLLLFFEPCNTLRLCLWADTLRAMGSRELRYISYRKSSEKNQPFPFFSPFETTVWEWCQHLEAHKYILGKEWEERSRGEGRDLKMKAEGEVSHYSWTRLIVHCCQKKGGPHFHLSFIPYLSVLAKQISPLLHGSSDMSLNLVTRFSSLSQEKTMHFFIFWGKSAFWKLNKLDPCSTRAGTRQGILQGMATPRRRSNWLDWFSHSKKTHPYPWETTVPPNN